MLSPSVALRTSAAVRVDERGGVKVDGRMSINESKNLPNPRQGSCKTYAGVGGKMRTVRQGEMEACLEYDAGKRGMPLPSVGSPQQQAV